MSDYGYGHATRSTAIIRELLKQNEQIKIIICHSFAIRFLQQSFKNEQRVQFRNVSTDIGYILKENSLEPDKNLLNHELVSYVSSFDTRVEEESAFMEKAKISFVISDISPLGIASASASDIPCLGISNFTWFTAYEGLVEDELLSFLKQQYKKMMYWFSLACSAEGNWIIEEKQSFGFYSRKIDNLEVQRIRKQIDPIGKSRIIYFGLGMKVDVEKLNELPIWKSSNCKFIVSSNLNIQHSNVYKISKNETETQYHVAAADLVITKAGWGTISEAICAGVPLLIMNRSSMKEDQNTADYLTKHNLCELINWEELQSIVVTDNLINKCRKQSGTRYQNETIRIAEEIIKKINSK
ncbi:glycosyltransferase family protein [Priestia megaterium]